MVEKCRCGAGFRLLPAPHGIPMVSRQEKKPPLRRGLFLGLAARYSVHSQQRTRANRAGAGGGQAQQPDRRAATTATAEDRSSQIDRRDRGPGRQPRAPSRDTTAHQGRDHPETRRATAQQRQRIDTPPNARFWGPGPRGARRPLMGSHPGKGPVSRPAAGGGLLGLDTRPGPG